MSSLETPVATRKPGLLINRNFAWLWAGQSISFIGDALLDFTLALWIAFDLGRGQSWAPLAVSGILVSSSVGTLVIGPIAGVFVDRWDKRRTLLRIMLLQAILTAALLSITDVIPLPFFADGRPPLTVKLVVLYAIIFVVYGCAQFTRPARSALIGDLVAEPEQPQASGLIETMANLSLMLGFGLAPVLFLPFGINFALLADALSFLLAFLAILAVKAPSAAHSITEGARGNIRAEFVAGVRFSFSNLIIRTLLIVYTIVLFGSGAINALLVFFLTQDLHAPPAAIGVFPIVLGLGLVLGSLLGAILTRRIGLTRLFWMSILVMGIAAILLSRQNSLLPGLLCGFLVGVPNGVLNTTLLPMVLRVTPRDMVGRVMTVLQPAMTVAQLASVALFGTLASTVLSNFHGDIVGLTFDTYQLLILIPGVLCLLAGAIAWLSLRRFSAMSSAKAAAESPA